VAADPVVVTDSQPPPAAGAPPPSGGVAGNGKPPTSSFGIGLSEKYTFESFVIGPSNRFAHAAALAVAESPGVAYNPLFVYGGVGLGKTHLLQAIGHYVLHHTPGTKVRFVTSEMFTNDFINSVREKKMGDFQRRFRTNDVLLIDDIQFLEHKEGTQEEFFHTFNTLHAAGKQIVMSSDRPPKQLHALEDRLVNRFESGLTVDIQPPTLETRIAILRKKIMLDHIRLADDEVLTLIASRSPSNIRELEGYLTRVIAAGSFSGRPIDVSLARDVLKDIPETAVTRITVDHILAAVSAKLGISLNDIKSDKRQRNIVQARHVAMYLARELTDLSLPKIGERIGGRDHTTVLHAVEKVGRLIGEDRQMYDLVQQLTTKIKSAR
jgi:chromosomal replication initiator protein